MIKAVSRIEKCWLTTRERIEETYSEGATIKRVRSGYVEDVIGLAEIKKRALLDKLGEHAAKRDREVAKMVYDYKITVCEERKNKKANEEKTEEINKT